MIAHSCPGMPILPEIQFLLALPALKRVAAAAAAAGQVTFTAKLLQVEIYTLVTSHLCILLTSIYRAHNVIVLGLVNLQIITYCSRLIDSISIEINHINYICYRPYPKSAYTGISAPLPVEADTDVATRRGALIPKKKDDHLNPVPTRSDGRLYPKSPNIFSQFGAFIITLESKFDTTTDVPNY